MLKGSMALQKHIPPSNARRLNMKPLSFSVKMHEKARLADSEMSPTTEADVDVDLREVYFLMMHFLSAGPCQRTCGQFWNELLEHDLLPRRYHAWYSRSGAPSGDENDDGLSFPLSYNKLVERYPYIAKDHLVKLLKQLMLNKAHPLQGMVGGNAPNAADVPTLLGQGPFSLLSHDENKANNEVRPPPIHMRWPHMHADQVRGLGLREIGGGFARHQRPASTRAACYAIAKPSTMVQKMQDIKKIRGHRNAVYCAIFDRSGRFVITGSDDRLVKVWSMETAYCLASCRGHEGDITDLAVSSNNFCVASSSNDCIIRVWHLPDGLPISVLRGHTGAVTAIAFNPRPSAQYQLLSSADDGTCRLWDARNSSSKPRIYVPRPADAGRSSILSSSNGRQNNQIFCCAFNASGTVFVTGSSDALARVWNACKPAVDDPDQPIHEMDILSGHENDVNYVQFSGCAVASRFSTADINKEENTVKFKSSWFAHDNIVTCSRDGSAIIWIPRSRKSHGKAGRWTRAYHLKVPPPPVPPQPPRGGPRQRVPPTPRGVNMIVWSLDNRFVLAAIMDCRICVWNAADGSLVHSLTGHTESTYVLDVHPFNPRIAMSAGYDGKTIIWDIWEGKPIRTYETGRFRLVDGKFSPDGTSIILSDDVGQLYILSTGQGESKKDAKYDQFFLGDYRPLIQDTHGNVLDQETQLAPYRRNMQDLLCDSSMIPYPEPYQSMYQKRRFGILGIEWRPSSVRFAVGPDLNSDQDFQIFPLADLDVLIDPLLEFVDAMDVEPEIEVLSDDTDSEYHGTEECSFGGNEVSFSSSTSDDLGCSGEDSGTEDADGVRRSKRKKKKTYIDMTTSSGRRVKRRNLDECDGISHRDKQTRKSKIRRKTSRKKSSSKSSRPRRAAARNALTLFSKIKRQSPGGEDVYGSEIDSSESESVLENSGFESEESDTSSLDEQIKRSKGKEIVSDDNENAHRPQDVHGSHEITSGRKRLVLKFPIRNSNKVSVPDHSVAKTQNNSDFAGSSSKAFDEAVEVHGSSLGQQNTRHLTNEQESILDLSEARMEGQIRWGGVRARTSKRMRLTETMPSATPDFITLNNGHGGDDDNCRGPNLEAECGARIGSSRDELDEATHMIEERAAAGDLDTLDYDSVKGIPSSNRFSSSNGLPHREASPDGVSCSANSKHLINGSTETSQNAASILTTLRIKSGRSTANNNGTHEKNGKCKPYSINPSVLDQKCSSDVERNGLQELEGHNANASSVSLESKDSHSRNSDRMFRAVYRRSKSVKGRTSLQGDGHVMGEGTSNVSSHNLDTDTGTKSDVADETQRTVSKGITVTPQESDLVNTRSIDGSRRTHNSSRHRSDPFSHEEWRSGMTVGLRSSRNRRVNYVRDISLLDRRKPYQSQKKVSWLMLSMPDGSRYIPQLGDEVAYLRQGHEEYVSSCRSSERGPWEYLKGQIRAVEFCNVVGLDYSTVPGSGDSCCKMTLEFLDPSSSVYGKTFKLTLPEVTSFPDFLVERTRYEAAMERNWTARDKCQVWWKNEGEECGSWWEGRIIAVKAKSPEFPDSPWERHQIQYKSDPGELHLHSPWELHDAETQWEQPHLDDLIKEKLLSAFSKLEKSGDRPQDTYGVQKLKQVSQKTNFFNRFPVPFSLDVIQSRLENNYYRNLEALKHDIQVMLSNAESYFGKNAELSAKMKRLSDCFNRTLSSL